MKQTYISPATKVFGVQSNAFICQSIRVGDSSPVSSYDDIGFAKEDIQSDDAFWDDSFFSD